MRSTKQQAREHLAAFQARETASPWNIDRRALAARLYTLVQSPSAVQQDPLPLPPGCTTPRASWSTPTATASPPCPLPEPWRGRVRSKALAPARR
jgi:hypothetical protein